MRDAREVQDMCAKREVLDTRGRREGTFFFFLLRKDRKSVV